MPVHIKSFSNWSMSVNVPRIDTGIGLAAVLSRDRLDSNEVIDAALQMQEAFVKMSSKEAAMKALRARTRPQRVFKPGDIVYVYRVLRKRKSVRENDVSTVPKPSKKAAWIGPGHVLALEGSVVWINMFGELWLQMSRLERRPRWKGGELWRNAGAAESEEECKQTRIPGCYNGGGRDS